METVCRLEVIVVLQIEASLKKQTNVVDMSRAVHLAVETFYDLAVCANAAVFQS